MADKIAEAFVEIRAHLDRLESDFGTAKSITQRETNSLAAIGTRAMSMATAGIAAAATAGAAAVGVAMAAVTAFGVKSVSVFASFEKGMNEVFTLLPGISRPAMDEMSDQVLQLSKDMNILPSEIIPALYQALSAGIPKDNVFEFLKTANMLAVGGVSDLKSAVSLLAAVTSAYGTDVLSVADASDTLFATVRQGVTTIPELSANLAKVTPIAAALGLPFDQLSALIANITKGGKGTAEGLTQISSLLGLMLNQSSDISKLFEGATGKTFMQFFEEGNNIEQALVIIKDAAADAGLAINELVTEKEGMLALMRITGAGFEVLGEDLKIFADRAGGTQKAFDQMFQGVGKDLQTLAAAFERSYIRIGKAIAPALGPMFEMMNELMTIAEEELTPAIQAIAEAFSMINPDASGARSLFAALADGMAWVVDALMSVAVALDKIAVNVDNLVWAAGLLKYLPTNLLMAGGAQLLMNVTGKEREEKGLSAQENLDKFRRMQDEREAVKKDQERIAALTGPIDPQQKANRAKEDELRYRLQLLEDEFIEIEDEFLDNELNAPKAEASAVKGFVDFVEFGRQLQDQLFDADEKRKTEEFQRKMEAFELRKAEMLEKNAAETKRVADQLEKIMVAT